MKHFTAYAIFIIAPVSLLLLQYRCYCSSISALLHALSFLVPRCMLPYKYRNNNECCSNSCHELCGTVGSQVLGRGRAQFGGGRLEHNPQGELVSLSDEYYLT